MITTAKQQYIKNNIHIPQTGDYTDTHNNQSKFRVVDVWEDDHYLNPHFCLTIQGNHYDAFINFMNNLPDKQQFADSTTTPYRRSDTVISAPYTTGIYYIDPKTGQQTLVGYDDYPVICLDMNQGCYFDDCENWTIDDDIIETNIHRVSASSLDQLLVEAKVIPNEAYGLETESVAFQLYRKQYPNVSQPDIWSVDPCDKITYFDMPQDAIQWLNE